MKHEHLALFVTVLALPACAAELKEQVALDPAGEHVDVVIDPPSANAYRLVGEVRGEAANHDPDAAHMAAKNDLRNKAAKLGAAYVTIDEDTGERVFMQNKTKVVVRGRAYKPVD
jgi:hypothetical protein